MGDEFSPPLDPEIAEYVRALVDSGVETFESCQGGDGHAYPEPTVRFHGSAAEGYSALSIALAHGFPVAALRRAWRIIDGELVGPHWELTFAARAARRDTGSECVES